MSGPPQRAFHVAHKGRKFGPLSLADLSTRRLTEEMLVWSEGMPQWVPVSQIPELAPYVQHAAATRTSLPPGRPGRPKQPSSAHGGGDMPRTSAIGSAPGPSVPPFTNQEASTQATGRLKFHAITSIVLGTLGLLCCPVSIVGSFFTAPPPIASGVSLRTLTTLSVSTSVAMLLLSVMMLVGGIGILNRKRWGATLNAITSGLCLIAWLASTGSGFVFVQLPLLRLATADNPGFERTALIVGMLIGALVTLVAMAWHATNMALLGSAKVRALLV